MESKAIDELTKQYQDAFCMLYAEIELFDETNWKTGFGFFLLPVKVAMHIADTLDFYFSAGITGGEYAWGHHFGGGWWELPEDQMPSQGMVLDYLHEIEARIMLLLSDMVDEDLSKLLPAENETYSTFLAHFVYAIRHTMHHQGALSTLAVYHGLKGGNWA
jgi:uncharacterized damage-inducible protein DinB